MKLSTHFYSALGNLVMLRNVLLPQAPEMVVRTDKPLSAKEVANILQRAYDLGKSDALHNLTSLISDMVPHENR